MKKTFFTLIISISWGIGIQALDLPINAQSLALSNTGIAYPINSSINASYNSNEINNVSFSSNYWFGGVSGKTIANRFGNHEILLNSYEINDLELWGDKPGEQPLGEFGLQFACLSYGYLINKSHEQNFGFKLKSLYSKLYTEYIYGLLIDAGIDQHLSENFNIGLTIKNIGYIKSDLAIQNIPTEYGTGISYNYSSLGLLFLFDVVYNDVKKEAFKLGCVATFKHFNIYTSFSKLTSNKYISTGFQMKYKNFSFSYGILFQEVEKLGIPQSFQITLYY